MYVHPYMLDPIELVTQLIPILRSLMYGVYYGNMYSYVLVFLIGVNLRS